MFSLDLMRIIFSRQVAQGKGPQLSEAPQASPVAAN
jgi:hypothetical protein